MKKIMVCVFLLACTSNLVAIGAGVFNYIRTDQGPEFLIAFDPNQTSKKRRGFECPGGTVGDKKIDGKVHKKSPITFLTGAIRETCEELVGFPCIEVNVEDILTKNGWSKVCMQKLLHAIKQRIEGQGVFFLQSRNHKGVTFFHDITDIACHDLPKEIVERRINLQRQGIKLHSCGSEPIAFAWIKGSDLLDIIANRYDTCWVPVTSYCEHDIKRNRLCDIDHTQYPDVVDSQCHKIKLSPTCVRMIQSKHLGNLGRKNECYVYQSELDKIIPSTMEAIIRYLQN